MSKSQQQQNNKNKHRNSCQNLESNPGPKLNFYMHKNYHWQFLKSLGERFTFEEKVEVNNSGQKIQASLKNSHLRIISRLVSLFCLKKL